jgi:hypothetical protein
MEIVPAGQKGTGTIIGYKQQKDDADKTQLRPVLLYMLRADPPTGGEVEKFSINSNDTISSWSIVT